MMRGWVVFVLSLVILLVANEAEYRIRVRRVRSELQRVIPAKGTDKRAAQAQLLAAGLQCCSEAGRSLIAWRKYPVARLLTLMESRQFFVEMEINSNEVVVGAEIQERVLMP